MSDPACPRTLRIVFASDTGLSRGHVYGLRILSFARVLAARGHQVVVISPDDAAATMLASLAARVSAHDWSSPLIVTAVAHRAPPAPDRWPAVVRKAKTVASLAWHGGTDVAWQRAVAPLASELLRHFVPEVVWATFGTTSNLCVAQRVASVAAAPWVGDLKDNVDLYVPRAMRRLLARRFADMADATSNAELHAHAAERWLGRSPTIVRSGIAPAMAAPEGSRPAPDVFLVTLIGSVYEQALSYTFFAALASWIGGLPASVRRQVRFRYAGSVPDLVRSSLAKHPVGVASEVTGNVSHAELATICQSAAVNCYLWLPVTFHHKALELLACRRPIIAFPGEHSETIELAARTGGVLMPCTDAGALAAALDEALERWRTGAAMPDFVAGLFSWEGQGEVLETVLRSAADRGRERVRAEREL